MPGDRLEPLLRQAREVPDDLGAAIRLALAYEHRGRADEALEEWERVIELDGSLGIAWTRVARHLERRGAVESALEAYAEGFRSQGRNSLGSSRLRRSLATLWQSASRLRSRASSISDRIRREAKAEDIPATPEELVSRWFLSETARVAGDLDAAEEAQRTTALGLGLDQEREGERIIGQGEESLRELARSLSEELGLLKALGRAGRRLHLVRDASAAGDEPRVLRVVVRPAGLVGRLNRAPDCRAFATVCEADGGLALLDRSGRRVEGVSAPGNLGEGMRRLVLAWSSAQLARRLSRNVFGGHDAA